MLKSQCCGSKLKLGIQSSRYRQRATYRQAPVSFLAMDNGFTINRAVLSTPHRLCPIQAMQNQHRSLFAGNLIEHPGQYQVRHLHL